MPPFLTNFDFANAQLVTLASGSRPERRFASQNQFGSLNAGGFDLKCWLDQVAKCDFLVNAIGKMITAISKRLSFKNSERVRDDG